ncbi:Trimeric intracellular cation channel type B [Cichlidogyrus casuarinus]|uniref:Trimeric intracellular cation channel type B n=1 Tax=Cichlidogyrus casuarinus TaxID=1844966 RepID=A0ABD2QJB0_9PLAT
MKLLERLVRGIWLPASTEFLHPTLTTKLSLLASLLFYFEEQGLIPIPENQLFLAITCLFIYLRLSMLCLGLRDPFSPLENIVCTLFFGGLVDAMKAALDKHQTSEVPASAATGSSMISHHHGDSGAVGSSSGDTGSSNNNATGSATNTLSGNTGSSSNLNGAVPGSDKISDKKRD